METWRDQPTHLETDHGVPKLNPDDRKKIERDFKKRLRRMLELAALGRGIEIIVRIADQTREGLAEVGKSYDAMRQSELRIPNLHPPKSLPRLFNDPTELERLRLARDIADELAHALYRHARIELMASVPSSRRPTAGPTNLFSGSSICWPPEIPPYRLSLLLFYEIGVSGSLRLLV